MITLRFQYAPSGTAELSFDNTATVRTAKEFLAKKLTTVAENITLSVNRSLLDDKSKLVDLKLPPKATVLATISTSRVFKFLQPGKQPFELPFRDNATVLDAKRAISPKMKVEPKRIVLTIDDEILDDRDRLLDLSIPPQRFITVEIVPEQVIETKYMFMMQGECREMAFDDEATIGDVMHSLLEVAEKGTRSVKLFLDGRPLKDEDVKLSSLRIPPGEFIVAECGIVSYTELRDKHAERPIVLTPPASESSSEEAPPPPEDRACYKLQKESSKVLSQNYQFEPPEREIDPPDDPMNVDLSKVVPETK